MRVQDDKGCGLVGKSTCYVVDATSRCDFDGSRLWVMPPAMLEQMAWDASVMPVSAEGVMFIAMGAETTEQSR
jgi:hypothetical protein